MNKAKKIETPKPWELTQADIDSITTLEFVWGTTRLLPPEAEIPKEFWQGNIYTRIADAMFVGEAAPSGEVAFNPGFNEDAKPMARCLMAHIKSFEPSHDHKIAGVGFMISKIVHVTNILT